jgi:hypothetical protein
MKDQVFALINEQTSPLFRIMSLYNHEEPSNRKFENNITAFHIGNGFILSVAHNLKPEAKIIRSLPEKEYQEAIISKCNEAETELFDRCYTYDPKTDKRYIKTTKKEDSNLIQNALKRINYDTRWVSQYKRGICKPFLIIQFEEKLFYNDPELTQLFDESQVFSEPNIGAHTFLIELELTRAFYSEDIALYRMTNIDQQIINRIPSTKISYKTLLTDNMLYCLQSSPSGTNLGRLFNEAKIEGVLDHHAIVRDRFDGNFTRNGLRYLLKGYFRFGSSGAPYFFYDKKQKCFLLNAIQSEASPIQLSIKNDRKGNFQYINSIASPIVIIEKELKRLIGNESTEV